MTNATPNNSKSRALAVQNTFLASLSASLILNAQNNPVFRSQLSTIFNGLRGPCSGKTDYHRYLDNKKLRLLSPLNLNTALEQAKWIKNELEHQTDAQALELLESWINDQPFEAPKQVVVGALAIAIPGITLGQFPKRKRMSVILKHGIRQKRKIAELSTKSINSLMLSALKKADFSPERLDPDLADWFYGDHNIKLFTADLLQMAEIKNDLKELGVSYSEIISEDEPAALALNPSINNFFAQHHWSLEEMAD